MRLVSAMYNDFYPFDKLSEIDNLAVMIDPDELRPDDMLVVWGGEDISPALYNKAVSSMTGATEIPSRRDRIEWGLMQRAKELGVPIIGVCRGAQMLCALAGGFLIQDVDNHAGGGHNVETFDGYEFKVNSYHHQMLYPFDVEHEMIASVNKPLSPYHLDVDSFIKMDVEPEFVYFPKVKGFAIQWHPEWLDANTKANKYVLNFIKDRL